MNEGPPRNLADGLRALGAGATEYNYGAGQEPDPKVLERFPNPSYQRALRSGSVPGAITVDIAAPEFTSLCPKTGQPDFATIMVKYTPNQWCVESKALKLYLGQFRMFGEFHEACVDRIGNDLVELLDPVILQVQGQFTPRGGIKFWPTFHFQRERLIQPVV